MSELLPCPFCGGEKQETYSRYYGLESHIERTMCACGAGAPERGSHIEAEDTWNRRALLPRERALVEAAKDVLNWIDIPVPGRDGPCLADECLNLRAALSAYKEVET